MSFLFSSIIKTCTANNSSLFDMELRIGLHERTNNISCLLCRSRPLHFIEDQLSLKNGIVKNVSQNTSRKMSGGLDTYLQETLGGQEKPLQKTHEKGGKK